MEKETVGHLNANLSLLKNWANRGLFFIYFVFSNTHHYNFLKQINVKNGTSIQYMVPGFELTTFGQ